MQPETTTLTNLEVITIYSKLNSLKSVPSFVLNKARTFTLKNLKPLADAYTFDKMCPKSEDYKAYEKEIGEEYKTLASVDGIAKTKMINTPNGDVTVLDFDINSAEAIAVRLKLDTKYQSALKEREAQIAEYTEWISKPCTDKIELEMITVDDMPKTDGDYKDLWDAFSSLIS